MSTPVITPLGRMAREQTFTIEANAHRAQRDLIRVGGDVSLVAFDSSRELYVFDILD